MSFRKADGPGRLGLVVQIRREAYSAPLWYRRLREFTNGRKDGSDGLVVRGDLSFESRFQLFKLPRQLPVRIQEFA